MRAFFVYQAQVTSGSENLSMQALHAVSRGPFAEGVVITSAVAYLTGCSRADCIGHIFRRQYRYHIKITVVQVEGFPFFAFVLSVSMLARSIFVPNL